MSLLLFLWGGAVALTNIAEKAIPTISAEKFLIMGCIMEFVSKKLEPHIIPLSFNHLYSTRSKFAELGGQLEYSLFALLIGFSPSTVTMKERQLGIDVWL